jgi:hypothetical protein
MKAISSSETSVNIYQTARCNTQEYSHLNTRRRKNLKSHPYAYCLWVSLKTKTKKFAKLKFFKARLFHCNVPKTVKRQGSQIKLLYQNYTP